MLDLQYIVQLPSINLGGVVDMGRIQRYLAAATLAVLPLLGATPQAQAGGACAALTLSCENGRSYPLCPIAVSIEGEIVTGRLGLGAGRGAHVRLVPMGVGYRYIGRGVWFDGIRNDAVLYLSKSRAVTCTVVRN
jgi:hypothetical protein